MIAAEDIGAMANDGPRTRRGKRRWCWLAVLVGLLGAPLMLVTLVIGVGDTSVGNSQGTWVLGDAILLGVPAAIAVLVYLARRQAGSPRRAALTAAVLTPLVALIGLGLVVWLVLTLT